MIRSMMIAHPTPPVEDAPRGKSPGHVPALDGIRGVAIAMVLVHHAVVPSIAPFGGLAGTAFGRVLFHLAGFGVYGVDLFFVLSGYLITGILLEGRDKPAYFATFFARRALRIFPLYFTYVLTVLVAIRLAWFARYGSDPWAEVRPGWYLAYLANWQPGHGMHDELLGHLWSLAVEEQFYLIWPVVVFLLPRRALGRTCLAIAVAAPFARAALIHAGHGPEALYRWTLPRADTLVIGSLLAILARDGAACARPGRPARLLALAGGLGSGLALVAGLSGGFHRYHPLTMTAGWSLTALLSGLVVASAATTAGRLSRILGARPLRVLGRYSYGLYVLHFLPLFGFVHLVGWRLPTPGSLPGTLLVGLAVVATLFASSLALAWTSMRCLERPFLRLKSRFTQDRPTVVAAGEMSGGLLPSGRPGMGVP